MKRKFLGDRRPETRLTQPLVRRNGRLQAASWNEALNRAAELFGRIRATDGGSALGVFSCSKSTNELNYLASKFARSVFHSNNIDSCNRT